ncbi:hypothetical protein SAY86_019593 [Trapa natans]|uniref:Zinc finger CCCH domain-containing protein 44 n=1 Tax=Trapa natans TaxID=22666 RepID=A0AAN7LNF2_TRANT|nr:hypothetical protein SAY86_019593 [Trapa natans]
MEAEEDDVPRALAGSTISEPESCMTPSGHQLELGAAGAQCESEAAGELQELPRDGSEESFPCMEEGTGDEGGGSSGGEGPVIFQGSDAASVESELGVQPLGAGIGKGEGIVCGREGEGSVSAQETVSSSPHVVQPPLQMAEEREVAADVTASESVGGGLEDIKCREVAGADKNIEEIEIASIIGVLEDNQVFVEKMGKEIDAAVPKGVEDHTEEVGNEREAVSDETELEASQQKETPPLEADSLMRKIVHTNCENVGREVAVTVDSSQVEVDARVDMEALESGREMDVISLEVDKGGELAAEEAADARSENTKPVVAVEKNSTASVEESTSDYRNGIVEVEAEAKKAGDDMMVGGNHSQEAAVDNKVPHGELFPVPEASENVEVLHEDINVVEDTIASKDAEKSEEVNMSNPPMKRKRGRAPKAGGTPKILLENINVVEDTIASEDAEKAQEANTSSPPMKRKDGRAPKAGSKSKILYEDINAIEDSTASEGAEKAEEVNISLPMKRKRGRAPKAGSTPKTPGRKIDEDVCFICFDGGDLVLCDRRKCPKAYHPSCVNHDEAFFRTKGQWHCGWHICSNCGNDSFFMCYTCTYSLCKTCIREGSIFLIRRNKGFCQTCMETISLIEDDLRGADGLGLIDFDDKSSWEYLFKDYYVDLKTKLSLTREELKRARNLWKGSDGLVSKQESSEAGDISGISGGDAGVVTPKSRQSKRQAKSETNRRVSLASSNLVGSGKASVDGKSEWASKELLEFVMHMRNGDRSILFLCDVHSLLLEYIKRNNLHDSNHKSQIVCDQRLQTLFGKPHIEHLEMLKLLKSHYFIKEDGDDLQGTVVDTDANESEKRQSRLEVIPEIHVNPKVGLLHEPLYKVNTADKQEERYIGGATGTPSFGGREPIPSQIGGVAIYDSWNSGSTIHVPSSQAMNKNSSTGHISARSDCGAETLKENTFSRVKEQETPYLLNERDNVNMFTSPVSTVGASRIISAAIPETRSVGAPQSASIENEYEKVWNYQDPSGKVQGPFALVQLRKWDSAGYFPVDLRIWRTVDRQEGSILLTDALNGKFQRDPSSWSTLEANQSTMLGRAALSLFEVPNYSGSERGSGSGMILPSPMPGQTRAAQTKSMVMSSAVNEGVQAPASASNASLGLSQGVQRPDAGRLLASPFSSFQLHSQETVARDSYLNQAASLNNLFQTVARNQNQSSPVLGEVAAPSLIYGSRPMTMLSQTQVQGPRQTSSGAAAAHSIPSFSSYVSSGSINPWQVLGSTHQSNIQPTALSNMDWLFGKNNNNSSNNAGNDYGTMMQGIGWPLTQGSRSWTSAALVPENVTVNFLGPAREAPAGNPTWPAQGQIQPTFNLLDRGSMPVRNPSPGTIPLGQGQITPAGSNSAAWASLWNENDDGSLRNLPWNRQSSISNIGGVGGGHSEMLGWCQFFLATGHCNKGASCNYRHT